MFGCFCNDRWDVLVELVLQNINFHQGWRHTTLSLNGKMASRATNKMHTIFFNWLTSWHVWSNVGQKYDNERENYDSTCIVDSCMWFHNVPNGTRDACGVEPIDCNEHARKKYQKCVWYLESITRVNKITELLMFEHFLHKNNMKALHGYNFQHHIIFDLLYLYTFKHSLVHDPWL